MTRTIKIGGAGGFWGDSNEAVWQLVTQGDVDYIIQDYLAELTMAIMAKQKRRNPDAGYATDFVTDALGPCLHEVLSRGIKVVTNAGGLNPKACAEALRVLAGRNGLTPRIAVVEGDDLAAQLDQLREEDVREMFTGETLPPEVTTINAYIGAFPIAAAISAGADIVITGRCADSALALGPLIHEFGWSATDFDRLAGGSMAGHLIECGTQVTGGLFTDWRAVMGRSNLGYPIVECAADGSFLLTKPTGTGGLINRLVAAEQLLYEVGDPFNYLLPDVTCDITDVRIEPVADDVVRISGIKGRAPTDSFKVSATYPDGFRSSAMLTIIGKDAAEKAEILGLSVFKRIDALLRRRNLGPLTETLAESLGTGRASFGASAPDPGGREVVLRVAARHSDRKALELFGKEIAPFGTAGTPGTTGFSGRPKPQEVFKLFSLLVPKETVELSVSLDGAPVAFDPERLAEYAQPLSRESVLADATFEDGGERCDVSLRTVAIARSGDKADIAHLAIIARDPSFYPFLLSELTPERIGTHFVHLSQGAVVRYEVPGISAMIFMLNEALGGGGTASLRSDALGKAFAEISLDMVLAVPASLLGAERERELRAV